MNRRILLLLLMGGLLALHACQKEYSFEGGASLSEGTLQDDGTGDCLPKTVAGAFAVGVALDPVTNYIEVQVDVTTVGVYTIYTDTVNGIWFRATGSFTTLGLNTVRLKGNGTPAAAGIHNFVVSYGTSGCSIAVTTSASLAAFTLDGAPNGCTGATPSGVYAVGTALTATNQVNISVNVTTTGAYTINTAVANGMTFAASGTFTTTGVQAVTLYGTGTPTTAGNTNIPITAGSTTCSFTVNVQSALGAATFTTDCSTASVNGTYTVGTALAGSNTVNLPVNVSTIGTYTITGTANGITFSGTGTFVTTGAQTVTLTGTGSPTTQGTTTVSLTGGTAACSVPVTVNPAAGGTAVFTTNCAGATVNGTYTVGVALAAANTITLPVTVTTAGTYTITATLNGMTFGASGSFAATGPQNVTLAGTGTPTTQGANSVPVTGGTAPCNIPVTVGPGAGGAATFTFDCSTATLNGYLTQGVAIAAVNTIELDVNVTTVGTYTITTTPVSGITYSASGTFTGTGPQTVILTGTGTPTVNGDVTLVVNSGSTSCNFVVTVDPNLGSWSFKVGATTYSGTFFDAAFDNTSFPPPSTLFYMLGDNAAGDLFEIDLGDLNGTISNAETYSAASQTLNASALLFDAPGTSYQADPSLSTNTLVVTVTTHNAATRTMTGTFTGNVFLNTATLVNVTNGQFTVTYNP